MIDVDSQVSCKYDSDTKSILADDDNDSNFDTVEYPVESATEDNEISDEKNLESDDDVEEESDESVGIGDASVVESDEESEGESKNESEDDSDDGHYLYDPDKEEYGAIVETDKNPNFNDMVDMLLHKQDTTAHVTSPSGKRVFMILEKQLLGKSVGRYLPKE